MVCDRGGGFECGVELSVLGRGAEVFEELAKDGKVEVAFDGKMGEGEVEGVAEGRCINFVDHAADFKPLQFVQLPQRGCELGLAALDVHAAQRVRFQRGNGGNEGC